MKLTATLTKYFGYTNFRPGQEEIIKEILKGRNVLAVLPTGAGKSICYQIPALISENFSIVISPLIALMKDQVDSLNEKEEMAAFINSTMSFPEMEQVLQKIAFGKIKLLYVAPERLENIYFAERIKKLNPSFLFIDEAHCISEWGHNFRPSYLRIIDFIRFVGVTKIAAFTATATPEVVTDIVDQLNFTEPKIFVKGFERENLLINVLITKGKKEKCLELLRLHSTPAIIYTASRKNAEEVAEYLTMQRINCSCYHAGLAPEIRRKIQENFLSGDLPVIAATNAFGMGINKKNIRLIIHFNAPGSIENYYQEIGRAGRDGKDSYTYLLYDDNDITIQNFLLSISHPDKELITKVYNAICDHGQIAIGHSSLKEIPINNVYINNHVKKQVNKGLIHACIKILKVSGYLKTLNDFEKKPLVQILLPKDKLKVYIHNSSNPLFKELLLLLIRQSGSLIMQSPVPVSIDALAASLSSSSNDIEGAFQTLSQYGIIEYSKLTAKDNVLLTQPRVSGDKLKIDIKKLNEAYLHQRKKLELMIDYVYSNDCRFKFILDYFGDNTANYTCGKCDRCRSSVDIPGASFEYIAEILCRSIYEHNSLIKEILLINIVRGSAKTYNINTHTTYGACANYDRDDIKLILHDLIKNKTIIRSPSNDLSLSEKGVQLLVNKNIIENETTVQPANYETNLELFNRLREVRSIAAKKFQQTQYLICNDELLRKIAEEKPVNKQQMLNIKSVTVRMFNKVGNDFLEIINEFLNEKENVKKETGAVDKAMPMNIKETYNLMMQGYDLKSISSLRKLDEAVVSMQIESIIHYEPKVEVKQLFPKGTYELICSEITNGINSLQELKSKLPRDISFPLIRIALAKQKIS